MFRALKHTVCCFTETIRFFCSTLTGRRCAAVPCFAFVMTNGSGGAAGLHGPAEARCGKSVLQRCRIPVRSAGWIRRGSLAGGQRNGASGAGCGLFLRGSAIRPAMPAGFRSRHDRQTLCPVRAERVSIACQRLVLPFAGGWTVMRVKAGVSPFPSLWRFWNRFRGCYGRSCLRQANACGSCP